ncbi:MAG: flagellar basal body rod protein FlgB [Peptococcaceae bacterium]|nr:flagellar basal body rod protein FlgB [Peptococcaceae bacterium]
MVDWLNDSVLTYLEAGLDGLSLRQKVLADNIANVDTPGFKKSDLDFEKYLQAFIDNRREMKLSPIRTSANFSPLRVTPYNFVEKDQSTSLRNDNNNVDIDLEMTKLAQNTIHYNALITVLTRHLDILKSVAKG